MPDDKKQSTFSKILSTAFPFVTMGASIFGGPAAGALTNKLGQALGLNKDNPTPGELDQAYLLATPEQVTAARKVELDFQQRMAEMQIDSVEKLESLAASDRASARQREMAVRDHLPGALAIFITLAFFGILLLVFRWGVKDASHDLALTMVGVLGAGWSSVVAYYFGSSAGSAEKSRMLGDAAKRKTD
jgi:hypothetical protein